MIHPDGLRARATVLHTLRSWFAEHGYLEVPTPTLVDSPAMEESLFAVPAGGGFLRTSPEFALKRAVASGLGRLYEIGPCYRDREHGDWHRREFLMCEWYRVGGDLTDLRDEVVQLVTACATALGRPVPGPWTTLTIAQAVHQVTGLDLRTCTAADLSPDDPDDWDGAFFRRWVTEVEPQLPQPCFLTDWPASQAALATVVDRGQGPVAQRFEAFVGGVELANAFQELRDPVEQRARFDASAAKRRADGEVPHPLDEAFVAAVGTLPRTAGIALGVDRLVAALMGWSSLGPGRVE